MLSRLQSIMEKLQPCTMIAANAVEVHEANQAIQNSSKFYSRPTNILHRKEAIIGTWLNVSKRVTGKGVNDKWTPGWSMHKMLRYIFLAARNMIIP